MHALPDDLRAALGLAGDEPIEHAALSGFPSPRGTVRSALVVTDRRVVCAEAAPGDAWRCRAHARASVTGLEIDGRGIGEATVALVGGNAVVDSVPVSRLDRRDFDDAGGVLARGPVVASDPPPATWDPPPVSVPVVEDAAPAGRRRTVMPPPPALPAEADSPAGSPAIDLGTDAIEFARVGPPSLDRVGSRFRLTPNPARPGDRVRLSWELHWPYARRVRGVHWEFEGSEQTRITVSSGKHSTTHREHHRVLRRGGTLWGQAAQGFLSNVADGLASLVGRGAADELPAGTYHWATLLTLPDDAPASFSGAHATVSYTARAWLDLPAAFDHRAGGALAVLPAAGSARRAEAHWPGGQRGLLDGMRPDILLTVRLLGGDVRPGGALHGEVACANQSGATVRGLTVTLLQREHARAGRHERSVDRALAELTLPAPDDARPAPFVIHLPDRPCHFEGRYASAHYYVRARVDVAWRMDVNAEVRVSLR